MPPPPPQAPLTLPSAASDRPPPPPPLRGGPMPRSRSPPPPRWRLCCSLSESSLYLDLLIHEYLTPAPFAPGLAMVYHREAGSFQNHSVEEKLSGPTAV
jgi:hypothetical protein